MDRPPCWPDGQRCPNECAARLYQRTVFNHHDLTGLWAGWRFRGPILVSPHGERVTAHALDRIMYREGRLFDQKPLSVAGSMRLAPMSP